MQTILGSGGIIGIEASYCLSIYENHIRQVSRNPKKVNESDQIYPADLTVESEVRQAVKGSDVVYLTAGLPYNTNIWKQYWPVIMKNTIKACEEHQAKLVFFDNVYMYGQVDGWMTEETPNNPCSKKGEVRAQIAQQLMDEVMKGNIQALIARSADFYGPKTTNTYVAPMIFDKLKNGKKPQIMINANKQHSFTYTPDAARAMALLGNSPDAYGQVWHLPSDKNTMTAAEFVKEIALHFQKPEKYTVLHPLMIKLASLFSPIIKETQEMLYQFENYYLFDSSKFEQKFFAPTSYQDGIKTIFQTQYK
ncbi:MAG: NAD-dependent epimerase/dehydratase family protein [Bacteroidales bacterium]|nr:NAD-dependent epimerase/dehydratase family protein [Bacteroidales bacterium]